MNFQITTRNQTKCTPVGKGTVIFQTTTGDSLRATNVLHVPGMGMNSISISQLQDKGYGVYFICNIVYFKHPKWKKRAQIGTQSNRLYKLQLESPMALISNNVDGEKELNELWHRRMGHLHQGALQMLKETITWVAVLTTKHDDTCRGCVQGKYVKAAYSRSNKRAKSVLGLIHSDICGPMSTRAISDAEYLITFLDDHSRKTWIYFLTTKDEVFDQFKEFKALMENQTGRKIKILRSNNGGEYMDKNFTGFCAKEGTQREWTTPYNPKQNGVAQRKNGTIVVATKAMLYDQNLPKFLWT